MEGNYTCREQETQSVLFIFINFFILNNLVLIVFKCTGTKIISLYLQYITLLVYTNQYIFIQCLYIQYIWRSWSCCTIVFFGADHWVIRAALTRLDAIFIHVCDLRASTCGLGPGRGPRGLTPSLVLWPWLGGGPTSSFSTQPAEGCFCLLSKLYVIVQL